MKFSFYGRYIPYYLLVLSLFVSSFVVQYAVLFVVAVWIIVTRRLQLRRTYFLQLPLLIILWAFISYLVNLFFTGLADKYSMLFWLVSYLPPFLLMWIILFDGRDIELRNIYVFYKIIVYFESLLLIRDVIRFRAFIVGDPATGTVGDANLVAFHICVVVIYELVRVLDLYRSQKVPLSKQMRSIVEIFYFLVVLLIPESTANLGLMIILAGLMFIDFVMSRQINLKAIATLLVLATAAFFVMKDGFVYKRLEHAVASLGPYHINNDPNLLKLKVYGEILTMQVIPPALMLTGTGPSTFTSRSSVIRIPEDRVNFFPYPLPYFKNEIFEKYVSSEYRRMRATRESYGNFASPQATAISVIVELGIVGLFLFSMFFVGIVRTIRRVDIEPYLSKFAVYFTIFFVMSLLHLNFWEYPIVAFTYILFMAVLIKQGKRQKTGG